MPDVLLVDPQGRPWIAGSLAEVNDLVSQGYRLADSASPAVGEPAAQEPQPVAPEPQQAAPEPEPAVEPVPAPEPAAVAPEAPVEEPVPVEIPTVEVIEEPAAAPETPLGIVIS